MGFWDGGCPASAGCLYGRYKLTKEGRVQTLGDTDMVPTHSVRLLMAKERVTPTSKGAGQLRRSNPRTELRGLLVLARVVTAVLPGLAEAPERISLMGDSECTISSVECDYRVLDTWFRNHVSEIREHMEDWERQGIKVDQLHHWPGPRNIADIATKGKANLEDMMPGSGWQEGPKELRQPRSVWPASRFQERWLMPS